ncbi:MAG: hypothetical protein ACYC5Y_05025 [Symbiobacteriia bacterium]
MSHDYVVEWRFYVTAVSPEEANEKAKDTISNDRPDETEVELLSDACAKVQHTDLLERVAEATRWHMGEKLACPASRKAVLDALAALDKEDGHA